MYAMLLNIIKARAQKGESHKVDIVCPIDDKVLQDRGCVPLSEVKLTGQMCYKDDKLHLRADAEIRLLCVCDNCGEEFERTFDFVIDEVFVENYILHSEEDYVILQGGINISEVVQDNLLLGLSSRLLCKEDCKGLCPICGRNRNKSKCHCEDIEREMERQEENPFGKIKR